MKLKMTLAVAALLTMGLSSAAAYANTVTFTLTNPVGYAPAAGGSFTYDATVTAAAGNSGATYLNGDSFNVTAPVSLDDSDFLNFPLSLAPGASFTGALFVLTVPPNTSFGTFLGSFTLLGGADGGAQDTLGSASFSLATTPEPSSVVLLLTGMAGLAWAGFNGRRRGWVS